MPSNDIFALNLVKDGSSGKKRSTTCSLYRACFWSAPVVGCGSLHGHIALFTESLFSLLLVPSGMIINTKTWQCISGVCFNFTYKNIWILCIAYNFTSSGNSYPRKLTSREKSFNVCVRTTEHIGVEITQFSWLPKLFPRPASSLWIACLPSRIVLYKFCFMVIGGGVGRAVY